MTNDTDRPADAPVMWKRVAEHVNDDTMGCMRAAMADGYIDCHFDDFLAALSAAGLAVMPTGEQREEEQWWWLDEDGCLLFTVSQIPPDQDPSSPRWRRVRRTVHVGPWEPVNEGAVTDAHRG